MKMKDEGGGVGSAFIIIGHSISEFTDGTTIVDVFSSGVRFVLCYPISKHPRSQFSEILQLSSIVLVFSPILASVNHVASVSDWKEASSSWTVVVPHKRG